MMMNSDPWSFPRSHIFARAFPKNRRSDSDRSSAFRSAAFRLSERSPRREAGKRLARRISRWFSYRLQMLGTNKRGKENNNRSKLNAKQEQPQHEYYMALWIPDMLPRCYCREKPKRRCLGFFLFGPTVFHCFNVALFRIQRGSVVRRQSDRLTKTRVGSAGQL